MENKVWKDEYAFLKVGNMYVKSLGATGVDFTQLPTKAYKIDMDSWPKEEFVRMINGRLETLKGHGFDAVIVKETVTTSFEYDEIDMGKFNKE